MWSAVAPDDVKSPAPSARSKHSATLVGEFIYILGGRNGNLPCKDFWKYNLVSGKWQQLKPAGDKLPSLQEHTAVTYKDSIYVFGGEVGFSAGTETPLWVYDIKGNCWKKLRTKKGVATPKGRRGHTALVYNGSMLIYGGYQDLRGSCSELWAFHFETESWHLLSSSSNKPNDQLPPPRHKHSAVLHGNAIWIYGGMTDLQERSDLWRFDISSRTWTSLKSKITPGPLHSHACSKMPSSMVIFGGERNGQVTNDLWKFNFDMESWEKITISGLKPQPRSESIALTVSELLLNGSFTTSLEAKHGRLRTRTCTSADRGNRHSSYLPNNKVAPCERTYVFRPSHFNYTDGSSLAEQYSENNRNSRSILQEISKLSQINITKMSNKCSYTVLTRGQPTDSTESLLRQHSSPQAENDVVLIETETTATPLRGSMVKSKSAYVIKKKYHDTSPSSDEDSKNTVSKKRVEFDSTIHKIPREPISVPNFSTLVLPTPVLTPVEASKLVYLDSDEENELINEDNSTNEKLQVQNNETLQENLRPVKRGDSYSSHLGYADNPLYQHMITALEEKSRENVSSTSDYASIETVNRLSSASNYSVKTNTPQDENQKNKDKDGPFGFCNPNYMEPAVKSMLTEDEKKSIARILSVEKSSLEHNHQSEDEDVLELQNYNGVLDKNTKVVFRHTCRASVRPPNLHLTKNTSCQVNKHRALSAGRAERTSTRVSERLPEKEISKPDAYVPLYIFVLGGKEQGHVTVFQRPISIWKLKLF